MSAYLAELPVASVAGISAISLLLLYLLPTTWVSMLALLMKYRIYIGSPFLVASAMIDISLLVL